MAIGKIYNGLSGELVCEVDYRLFDSTPHNWWGELTLADFRRINDYDSHTIELDDGRKGRCSLTKKVNKAVSGLLPLYCYRFRGNGELK